MADSRTSAGDGSPRDTLWLLMAGVAVVLYAHAALSVAGAFAYRRARGLLVYLGLS